MKRLWLPALGIVVLTFLAYANSFGNEFLFDDISQIVTNTIIREPARIVDAFTHHLTYFSEKHRLEGKFYRPLQTVTLMWDYLLWGKEPFGYHITNTLLHAVVAVLFFLFMLSVTRASPPSFLAAAVYAVHPVHTEAVTYVSGRADSICTIFLLLMVIFQRRFWAAATAGKRTAWYLLILASFVMALFGKEFAVTFPFLLMLCEYCLRDEKPQGGYTGIMNRKALFYLPLFIIMGAWFLIKNAVVVTETMVMKPASLATRLISVPRNIVDYLRLSFVPTGLHMEYKLPFPRTAFQSGYIEPLLISIVLAAGLYYVWRRGRRDAARRVIFFGFAWFLVGLLPYLSIFFQLNAPFAEHWLYTPEMGFLLGLFYALYHYTAAHTWMRRALAVLGGLVVAVFIVMTARQNTVWNNSLAFYTYTLKYAPYSPVIYNNLAIESIKAKDFARAEVYFRKALELDPDYETAKLNLEQLAEDRRRYGIK